MDLSSLLDQGKDDRAASTVLATIDISKHSWSATHQEDGGEEGKDGSSH